MCTLFLFEKQQSWKCRAWGGRAGGGMFPGLQGLAFAAGMLTRCSMLPWPPSAFIHPPGVGSCWCRSQSLMWHFSHYYYFSLAFFSLCCTFFFLFPCYFPTAACLYHNCQASWNGHCYRQKHIVKTTPYLCFFLFPHRGKTFFYKGVLFSCSLPLGILLNWFLLPFYRWDILGTIELILVLSNLI